MCLLYVRAAGTNDRHAIDSARKYERDFFTQSDEIYSTNDYVVYTPCVLYVLHDEVVLQFKGAIWAYYNTGGNHKVSYALTFFLRKV